MSGLKPYMTTGDGNVLYHETVVLAMQDEINGLRANLHTMSKRFEQDSEHIAALEKEKSAGEMDLILLDNMRLRIAALEKDRNTWRESAEQLGRQVASLTHNIPIDIPLKEAGYGGEE